jgi:N-acyl-D-amino-acid deacylase
MGLTTEAVGNCGHLPAPITEKNLEHQRKQIANFSDVPIDQVEVDWKTVPEFYTKFENQGIGINVVPFIGHGTLRRAVMGKEKFGGERRVPTDEEMEEMKRIVTDAMKWGACGMTTGLSYEPGRNAYTEEVIELCKIIAQYDGVYMSHRRYGGDMVADATKELIEIGKEAGLTVVGSHFKARIGGRGPLPEVLLNMIDNARGQGVDVVLDIYPWDRSQVGNLAEELVPPEEDWTIDKLLAKLKNAEDYKKVEEDTLSRVKEKRELTLELSRKARRSGEPDRSKDVNPQPTMFEGRVIVYSMRHPEYLDKTIDDIAKIRGVEPVKALIELVLEDEVCTRVAGTMVEEDVQAIMRHHLTMISTDAWDLDWIPSLRKPTGFIPHPRNYGTYPRVLGHYSRDLGLFPLEEAIRKMTSLPAQTLKLKDHGLLREGFWANVVIFNPRTVSQGVTYAQYRYPKGIEYVLVNGKVAVERGEYTKTLSGKVLRRSEK